MAKLYTTVNAGAEPLVLERTSPSAPWTLPGGARPDLVRTGPGQYSLVHNGRSFRVLVLKEDREANTVRLRIGAHTYTVQLQDEQSRLMNTLGLDKARGAAVKEIKAPRPGLVLKLLVKEGDAVKKNDPVLILEAMKMENELHATKKATVTAVLVKKGDQAERGQLLVAFE